MRRSRLATACSLVSTHLPLREPMRLSSSVMRTWGSSKRPRPTTTLRWRSRFTIRRESEARQAEALNGQALAARARGDLPAAIEFGEESLKRIEALRAGVSAPELRAFYSAAHSDYYENQIESLLAAHRAAGEPQSDYLTASLSVSERARARMVVDLLNEAAVRLDRGEVPEAALERERELYDELGALRYQRDRLLETPNLEEEQLEPLVRRMTAIENELSLSTMAARRSAVAEPSVAATEPLTLRRSRRRWTTAPSC